MRTAHSFAAALVLTAVCVTASSEESYPEFPDEHLRLGRTVWLDTCKVCHTSDIAGAPQITDRSAWAQRLQKGKDVLYQHALEGFHGPMGTEMPPRGGNAALSDEQVRAAVDYMVALVSQGS